MRAQRDERCKVLLRGESGVKAGPVDEPGDTVRRGQRASHRNAEDLQTPRVGDGQTQQQAQKRGLAGTVRADQAVDLTLRHVHIDMVERDDITEDLGDAAAPHCDGRIHPPLPQLAPI